MKKILLADDESVVCEFLENFLSAQLYDVASVRSGGEAVEKVQSWKPDLLLLDVQMPGMNGLQALSEIRTFQSHLKVIMLTGEGDPSIIEKILQLGANHYITKPFKLDYLLKQIKEAFES